MIPRVLTIAGSDASGGAGQLADLKIFEEYGVFGIVSLTCIVAFDKDNSFIPEITNVDPKILKMQLDTAFSQTPLAAVKTGMIADCENIELVAQYLIEKQVQNIVVDPVMACKHNDEVQLSAIRQSMRNKMVPLATITTPNLLEAEYLSGLTIQNVEDMKEAAKIIVHDLHAKNVVIKGGARLAGDNAIDVFYDGQHFEILETPKIQDAYNHGAGCTFAAAITAGLAKGYTPLEATKLAKTFVYQAIQNSFKINENFQHIWHGAYNHAEERMNP